MHGLLLISCCFFSITCLVCTICDPAKEIACIFLNLPLLVALKAIIIVLQSSNSLQSNPIGLILQTSDPCRSRPPLAIEIIIMVFHFLFQNGVS